MSILQVRIKRTGNQTAVLISFDTDSEKFDSVYERNKFFSELHGRKQIVIKDGRRYEYRRDGMLDEVPHLKIANSVFVIMQQHLKMMEQFFDGWEDKVMVKSFPVVLDRSELRELEDQKKEMEKDVEVE